MISENGLSQRYPVLYQEFENERKKRKKNFDLPERGFEPHIFSNFPAHDLYFHGTWKVREMRSNLGKEVKISRLVTENSKKQRILKVRQFQKEIVVS